MGAQLPAPSHRVLADDARRDLRVDGGVDVEQPRIFVSDVRLADDALLGVDPRDNRRAMRHLVEAAARYTRPTGTRIGIVSMRATSEIYDRINEILRLVVKSPARTVTALARCRRLPAADDAQRALEDAA